MLTKLMNRRRTTGDSGVALLTVMIAMMVLTALSTTVAVVAIDNVGNANRDRQAGGALATSEGGVAQAIEYIRRAPGGLSAFNCMESATGTLSATCSSNPAGWTSMSSPQEVPIDRASAGPCVPGEACYKVWISTLQALNPPASKVAKFRIRSTGLYGGGPAARAVVVDVIAQPFNFPVGVYADTLAGNGNPGVHRESLFTQDCVTGRLRDASNGTGGGIKFQGDDIYNDIPAAAHSTKWITTSNNGCGATDNGNVHRTGVCNSDFPYDQDGQGGPLSGSPSCYRVWTSPTTGATYSDDSAFTSTQLQAYGYRPGGLTDAQYDDLRTRAKQQGTYYTSSSSSTIFSDLTTAGLPTDAVVFFDLAGVSNQTVTIGPGTIPSAYIRDTSDGPTCDAHSVVFVVMGSNTLKVNSLGVGNSNPPTGLVGSLFVPQGTYDGGGNANVIGTLFANTISLQGTPDFRLDRCFTANLPSGAIDVKVVNFREDDSRDAN